MSGTIALAKTQPMSSTDLAAAASPQSPSSPPKSLARDPAFLEEITRVMPLIRPPGDLGDDLYVELRDGTAATLHSIGASAVHTALNQLADRFACGDLQAVLGEQDFRAIQEMWRAKAFRLATVRPMFKRVGWHDNAILIDLTDAAGRMVEITADGWTVVAPAMPMFVRTATQRPLPIPAHADDGDAALARLLPPGLSDDDRKLLTTALLGFLLPSGLLAGGSYPILALVGESGSGKSTAAKRILQLVDPHTTSIAGRPKTVDDLFVSAQARHLLAFDNIDGIKGSFSDACCQLTTGSAIAKRKLYSDGAETVLPAHNPLLINGISPDLPKQDFLDRCITIQLHRLGSFDPEVNATVTDDLPKALGYLCDLLATALANYAQVTLPDAPRLAMVAKIATAAQIPGSTLSVVELLRRNQTEALTATKENDPIIDGLFALLARQPNWEGTYKDLLTALTAVTDELTVRGPDWPRSPHKLADFLGEHTRLLRDLGIAVTRGPKRNNGRIVHLLRGPAAANDIPF